MAQSTFQLGRNRVTQLSHHYLHLQYEVLEGLLVRLLSQPYLIVEGIKTPLREEEGEKVLFKFTPLRPLLFVSSVT